MEFAAAWTYQNGTPGPLMAAGAADRALRPGLTVAICTYQRPASLSRLVDSLAAQERTPDALIVVDASANSATEDVLKAHACLPRVAGAVVYIRVIESMRGLPKQRNLCVRYVDTDLTAFLDDDVVLLPGCLAEMERQHRLLGNQVVGVGAVIEGYAARRRLWMLRLILRMVPSLEPGRYYRSGMGTSWRFQDIEDDVVPVDFLPGGAAAWRTEIVQRLGFRTAFSGYAQGEDLEFSLRARRYGALYAVGGARLLHLHEPSGRPDSFARGYMAIRNRYQIHRIGVPDRTWKDVAWFIYAWTVDTVLLGRHLIRPSGGLQVAMEVSGRVRAAYDLLRGHS